jgi:hypothetical protein
MTSWIHFKNKFNDKFLNQEVEWKKDIK